MKTGFGVLIGAAMLLVGCGVSTSVRVEPSKKMADMGDLARWDGPMALIGTSNPGSTLDLGLPANARSTCAAALLACGFPADVVEAKQSACRLDERIRAAAAGASPPVLEPDFAEFHMARLGRLQGEVAYTGRVGQDMDARALGRELVEEARAIGARAIKLQRTSVTRPVSTFGQIEAEVTVSALYFDCDRLKLQ